MRPTDEIAMPANAFYFFLESVPFHEPLLRPAHTVTSANAAQEYIAARELWRACGWAVMDFDGLTLCEAADRFAYPLRRCKGLLRWEHDGGWEGFVRGPACLLWARQQGGPVTLTLASGGLAIRRLREGASDAPRGVLTALRMSDRKTERLVLDGLAPQGDAFADGMERQMKLFYREAQDA